MTKLQIQPARDEQQVNSKKKTSSKRKATSEKTVGIVVEVPLCPKCMAKLFKPAICEGLQRIIHNHNHMHNTSAYSEAGGETGEARIPNLVTILKVCALVPEKVAKRLSHTEVRKQIGNLLREVNLPEDIILISAVEGVVKVSLRL